MPSLSAFFRLRRFDWGLLLATLLLLTVGLAAIASLSLNNPHPNLTTFLRQLVFALVGLVALLVVSRIDYRFFRSSGWLLYVGGLALLVAVLLFGTVIHSTRGWFTLFGQSFQPVEPVKVMLIIVLAKVLAERFDDRRPWQALLLTGLVVIPLLVLVFRQNDLGSMLMLGALWFAMLLLVRMPFRTLLVMVLLVALLVTLAWFTVLKDYQRQRVRTFLDPNLDPFKIGYSLRQAQVAVGSGQLFGRGLGLGPQSQLNFLPVPESDFIFAVIAEELGFVGSVLVFGLYGFFFARLLRIMRDTTDDFGAFLVGGVASQLFIQTVANIGMNINLLPVVGLPLPFLSYGGSSLIASLTMVGIAESVAIRSRSERLTAGERVHAGTSRRPSI